MPWPHTNLGTSFLTDHYDEIGFDDDDDDDVVAAAPVPGRRGRRPRSRPYCEWPRSDACGVDPWTSGSYPAGSRRCAVSRIGTR